MNSNGRNGEGAMPLEGTNNGILGQAGKRIGKVASGSSIGSVDEEPFFSDDPSDDLDKLSMCLSEVSSENTDGTKSSLLSDIIQAQLALWTLIITIFYSYAWQQHRKKFLISVFVVVPPVIFFCCTMSSLLTAIVILGRLFSSPVRFQDILKFETSDEEYGNGGSSGGTGSLRRHRSLSGNSCQSTVSISGRSVSCEELPKPVCRKHSNGGSSLSLYCGTPTAMSLNGNGFACSHNGGSNGIGTNGNGSSGVVGMFGRSESLSGGSMKPSHQFSHYTGGGP